MATIERPFGNLINRIQEQCQMPEPEVGMGATELCYSDRHACTIIEVISPTRIVVQEDKATRTDNNGMSDAQEYAYEPNPNGRRTEVTRRKNGRWIAKGESLKEGTAFALGHRDEHYDFSF